MKRKKNVRLLIYALPTLALGASLARADPESPAHTVESHIEVRKSEASRAPVTFLGVEVTGVDEALAAQLKLPPDHGLIVRFVVPDSPAATAGLQKHDILMRLDDQVLIEPRQLSALVRGHQDGDTVQLTYLRAGSETKSTVKLMRRVPPKAASTDVFRWFGEAPEAFGVATQRHIVHTDASAPAAAVSISTAPDAPRVMVFRPSTRILYREGDIVLEVKASDHGRELEARDASGTVVFRGPIATEEQRNAVPEHLQRLLEKLDSIEPSALPLPGPGGAPRPLPAPTPAPAPSVSWDVEAPCGGTDVLIHSVKTGDAPATTAGGAI